MCQGLIFHCQMISFEILHICLKCHCACHESLKVGAIIICNDLDAVLLAAKQEQTKTLIFSCCTVHIGRSKGGAWDAPGPNSFIFMQFSVKKKIAK